MSKVLKYFAIAIVGITVLILLRSVVRPAKQAAPEAGTPAPATLAGERRQDSIYQAEIQIRDQLLADCQRLHDSTAAQQLRTYHLKIKAREKTPVTAAPRTASDAAREIAELRRLAHQR